MNNFVQENMKIIVVFGIIYLIIIIAILSFIWSPDKKAPEFANYTMVGSEGSDKLAVKKYTDEIVEGYQLKDSTFLYEKTADGYWNYTGETSQELIKQMNKLDTENVKIGSAKKYISGNTNVYVLDISFGSETKKLNLIEDYPGNYKYSLGTFYKYITNSKNNEINSVGYFVKSIYQDMNYIELNLEIYNNNKESVSVKMQSPSDVELNLSDGKSISVSNTSVSSGDEEIKSGSKMNKKILFNMPLEQQAKIESISLNSVYINKILGNVNFKIEL